MSKLDDFIQEIHADEALPFDHKMKCRQQERIEAMIFEAIGIEKSAEKPVRRLKKRRVLVFALAAVLLISFAVTAGAAVQNDWDVALMNFMGISDTDTVQLEGGEVKIGEKAVCSGLDFSRNASGERKEMTVTAVSSVGDKNSAYIRIDTDYELPKDFNAESDYVLPEEDSICVFAKDPQTCPIETTKGAVLTSVNENGRLVFMLYISNCQKLNKSYVSVNFKNLYLHHDLGETEGRPGKELLYKGSVTLNWKYSYQSNIKSVPVLRVVRFGETPCLVTKMEISPLSVRLEGLKLKKGGSDRTVWMDIDRIAYKDGTIQEVGGSSQAGCKNGIFLEGFCDISVLQKPLKVQEIASVTVGGVDIKVP